MQASPGRKRRHGDGLSRILIRGISQLGLFQGEIEKFASKRGYVPRPSATRSIEKPTGNFESSPSFRCPRAPSARPLPPCPPPLSIRSRCASRRAVYFAATTACARLMHFAPVTTGHDRSGSRPTPWFPSPSVFSDARLTAEFFPPIPPAVIRSFIYLFTYRREIFLSFFPSGNRARSETLRRAERSATNTGFLIK